MCKAHRQNMLNFIFKKSKTNRIKSNMKLNYVCLLGNYMHFVFPSLAGESLLHLAGQLAFHQVLVLPLADDLAGGAGDAARGRRRPPPRTD